MKSKDRTREWLLSFEKLAGVPVVVSVLVKDGKMTFNSCAGVSDGGADDSEPDHRALKRVFKKDDRPKFSTSIKAETNYIR